ncbi:hypothetical protein LPTSP4_08520 [Leptospira ryugenii]|uniref:Uncharacterized protein n=1 Tax=Leptospira ryugenii TaxID=1917863 RepID=A0A2P2DXI0_9LEPT|nr:hypothetical protein [Leptospira ryugenii]GBF49341.1 hypothetical protein LPTSP4_08520 [Leptospira ryugenii]
MEELIESFENQLIYLYDEKLQLEKGLGTSDPKEIVGQFKQLEQELVRLYGIKERYKKVPSKEITISDIKNVFIDKNRIREK